MDVYISPNYLQDKLDNPTFDDLVDVFKDRMLVGLLEPARKLNEDPNFYYASLNLQMTYFEGIWSYIKGEDSSGKSKLFFRYSFQDIFRITGINQNLLGRVADILYKDARCGFFHEASLRSRVLLAETSRAEILITLPKKADSTLDIEGEIRSILVNPVRFLMAIENHFIGYVLQLRQPGNAELRDNFYKMAKQKWDWETDGVILGIGPDGKCST
jgi:hypothetical protein